MSENGQEVFFQTSSRLVPQDTNSTLTQNGVGGAPGMDVYEWEADGAGGCSLSQGCTYLLSSGQDVGPAVFLGASLNGENVFFATAAQLVPQATPEFSNIYDVRVEGGLAPPPAESECLSCQGVGSPPPLFSPGASLTFTGAGNPAPPAVSALPTPKKTTTKTARCEKGLTKRHSKCVKTKRKKKAKKASRGAGR
jgi:hypothetical protein